MKKRVWLGILLILTFTLCGCGGKASDNGREQGGTTSDVQTSLYEHGLRLVDLLSEAIVNESYKELFLGNDGPTDIINAIAEGDYTKVKDVYALAIKEDSFDEYMTVSGADTGAYSDAMKEVLQKKMLASMAVQITARSGGVEQVAVAGAFRVETSFVEKGLTEDVIYIYIFESGYPVAVTYVKGEEGAVSANACFLPLDELSGAGEDTLREIMSPYENLFGCEVRKLDLP